MERDYPCSQNVKDTMQPLYTTRSALKDLLSTGSNVCCRPKEVPLQCKDTNGPAATSGLLSRCRGMN
jgi:hypothetical protein